MKFLCVLLLLIVLAHSGFSLICYKCNEVRPDQCIRRHPNLEEQMCGLNAPGYKPVCYYSRAHGKINGGDVVSANCALVKIGEQQLQECLSTDSYEVKECIVCDTDYCNI